MYLEIITPEAVLYSGEVNLVRLPGELGFFEVLKGHAPIISTLKKGKIKVKENSGYIRYVEIDGGIAEVLNDEVKILVET